MGWATSPISTVKVAREEIVFDAPLLPTVIVRRTEPVTLIEQPNGTIRFTGDPLLGPVPPVTVTLRQVASKTE